MNHTTFSDKRTTRRKITAEQLAAAVGSCSPDNLVTESSIRWQRGQVDGVQVYTREAAPAPDAVQQLGLLSPPVCNTGVETNKVVDEAPQRAIIDYLRFVVKEPELLPFYLDFFGGSAENWVEKDRGFYGYRHSHWCSNIAIFSDGGEEGMGFCVQLSGLGCREFESSFGERTRKSPFAWSWQFFLAALVRRAVGEGGLPGTLNVTRLDVALDDRTGALDLAVIKEATLGGLFSCRGGDKVNESPALVQDSRKRGQSRRGLTLEFGRKSSTQMVRIYDKAAEMCAKGVEVVGDWVRTEYQANAERAHMLAQLISLDGLTCVPSIIQGYLDFKADHGYADTNRYKAPSATWWSSFLESWEKITLTLPPTVQTFETMKRFLEHQVSTTLATVYDACNSGRDLLEFLIQDGRKRQKAKHRGIITRERQRYALASAPGPTGF